MGVGRTALSIPCSRNTCCPSVTH